MERNDLINGSFELISALFSSINIFMIIRDKKLMGMSWLPTFFFTIWGVWNLYYYPTLNQMFSFVGGLAIFIVNIIWLILLFYYKYFWNKNSK